MNMTWNQILPDVYRFPDSCNVYAMVGPEGSVIVDAGTGRWLDHLAGLPKPPVALAADPLLSGIMRRVRCWRHRPVFPCMLPEGEVGYSERSGAAFPGARDLHHLR